MKLKESGIFPEFEVGNLVIDYSGIVWNWYLVIGICLEFVSWLLEFPHCTEGSP